MGLKFNTMSFRRLTCKRQRGVDQKISWRPLGNREHGVTGEQNFCNRTLPTKNENTTPNLQQTKQGL